MDQARGLSAADARTLDGQLSTRAPPYLALFAALLVNILKKSTRRKFKRKLSLQREKGAARISNADSHPSEGRKLILPRMMNARE